MVISLIYYFLLMLQKKTEVQRKGIVVPTLTRFINLCSTYFHNLRGNLQITTPFCNNPIAIFITEMRILICQKQIPIQWHNQFLTTGRNIAYRSVDVPLPILMQLLLSLFYNDACLICRIQCNYKITMLRISLNFIIFN